MKESSTIAAFAKLSSCFLLLAVDSKGLASAGVERRAVTMRAFLLNTTYNPHFSSEDPNEMTASSETSSFTPNVPWDTTEMSTSSSTMDMSSSSPEMSSSTTQMSSSTTTPISSSTTQMSSSTTTPISSSTTQMSSSTTERNSEAEAILDCYLCELIVEGVEEILTDNENMKDIKETLKPLCYKNRNEFQDQTRVFLRCVTLVEYYTSTILRSIVQNAQSGGYDHQICTRTLGCQNANGTTKPEFPIHPDGQSSDTLGMVFLVVFCLTVTMPVMFFFAQHFRWTDIFRRIRFTTLTRLGRWEEREHLVN